MPSKTQTYKGRGITVYININISMHREKSPTGVRTESAPTEMRDKENITIAVITEIGKWYLVYRFEFVKRRVKRVNRENDPNTSATERESVFPSSWIALIVRYIHQNSETTNTYTKEYLKTIQISNNLSYT